MQAEASVAQVVAADDAVSPSSTSGPIPGLVWAFCIHSDGSPEALPVDEPISFAHDGLLWLHFNGRRAGAAMAGIRRTSNPGPGAEPAAVERQLPATACDR
jgi:hypothetical protein